MAVTVADLQAKLALDISDLRRPLAQAVQALDDGMKKVDALGKSLDSSLGANTQRAIGHLSRFREFALRAFEVFTGFAAVRIFEDIIGRIRDLATEMTKLGFEAKVQETAFQRLAAAVGVNADALIARLKEVSGGIINESDIMLAAARALQQGLQPQQIIALMQIAREQSKLTGDTVTAAFNTMTEAIANNLTRALKHFGVTTDTAKALDAYAASLGVTADRLTDMGRTQAVANAVISDMLPRIRGLSGASLDLKERVEEASAAWKQFKEDIGKGIVDALLVLADAFRAATSDVSISTGGIRQAIVDVATTLAPMLTEIVRLVVDFARVVAPSMATVRDAFLSVRDVGAAGLGVLDAALRPLGVSVGSVAKAFSALFQSLGIGIQTILLPATAALAFIGSLLADIGEKRLPSLSKASEAAATAVREAFDRVLEGGERLNQTLIELGKGTTVAPPIAPQAVRGLAEATKQAGLGVNAFGDLRNQIRAFTLDARGLTEAMAGLAAQFEATQVPEGALSTLAGILKPFEEQLRKMAEAGMPAELVAAYRQWGRSIAQAIVTGLDAKQLAAEVVEALEKVDAATAVPPDIEGWARLGTVFAENTARLGLFGDAEKEAAANLEALREEMAATFLRGGDIGGFVDRIRSISAELDRIQIQPEVVKAIEDTTEAVDLEIAAWARLAGIFGENERLFGQFGERTQQLEADIAGLRAEIIALGNAGRDTGALIDRLREKVRDLAQERIAAPVRQAEGMRNILGPLSGISTVNAEFEAIRQELERNFAKPVDDVTRLAQDDLDILIDRFADLKRAMDLKDVSRGFFESLDSALTQSVAGVIQGTQTIGQAMRNLGQSVLLSINEMIIKRGLKALQQAIDDFIDYLQRSGILRQIISAVGGAVAGMFGGGGPTGVGTIGTAGGGSPAAITGPSGSFGVVGMQEGGIITKPTFLMAGEKGREAIIPLDQAQGLQSGPLVQVVINNKSDAEVETAPERTGPDGQRMIEVAVNSAWRKAAAGGEHDVLLNQLFGLSRRGRRGA